MQILSFFTSSGRYVLWRRREAGLNPAVKGPEETKYISHFL